MLALAVLRVRAPDESERPKPVKSVMRSLFTKSAPAPNVPVVVAFPTMVEEAVERKPFNNPRVVVVETPQVSGVNGNA